ncbi:MAG TPA: hypothetical protein VE820_05780 [Sphingomicrobium sp.]|jgi:hypothetical protein|nr:hypothetical protein [Sphingomicrobium sp.]
MSAIAKPKAENIEHIHCPGDSTPVSDELRKLASMLVPLCPRDSSIRFDFDGSLRVHIDVRRFEEMTTLESLLPMLFGGIFHDVQRGMAEKHSFFHRLSAVVAR